MTVPTPIVEWASAKGPYELVDTYANFTGASGAYVSTPDSAAVSVTGDIEIVVRVMLTDWTPSAPNAMVGKFAAGSRDYWFEVRTDGKVKFGWSSDGATLLEAVSTVATGFSDGLTYWLKVTRNSSTGTVTFSYASDFPNEPTSWTGLGASVATAPSAMNNGTSPLWLGGLSGGTSWLSGRVYQATIRNGINGTTVAEFHADRDSIPGSSTFVSLTTGQTWTFNGAASRVSDWVDLSADIQSGTVRMGRQYELDRFNAGSATITWNTDSRLFDFDNSASAYSGQLQPMRQFRIRMRRNDQVWPIFRGYVIDWDQITDDADKRLFTTVRLGDAFALLDATQAPSPYATAVLAKNPVFYARLDDANQVFDSSTYANHGTWGSLATIVSGLLVNDANDATSFTATSYGQGALQPPTSWTDFTLEFWIQTTTSDCSLLSWFPSSTNTPSVFALAGGKLRVTWNGMLFTEQFETLLNDGVRHHVVYRSNGISGSVSVDDVAASKTSPAFTTIGRGLTVNDTYRIGYNPATGLAGFVGTLDELALYSSTGTASTYTTGITPWANQTTGARVTAILDAIGWPAALRDIDTGDSTMQLADITTGTALAAVQQAADTEIGQTYADEYGNVHHRSRSNLWLQARSKSSQVTFQDRWSGTTKIYSNQGFSMVRDALLLRNPVTAARANGTTITRRDSSLIQTYGLRDYAAPMSYDSSDLVVADRAQFLLARYKDLRTRIQSMTVHVHRDPADLAPTVGTTIIGTRITVVRKPLNIGTATSVEQIVEGITHQFAPRIWSTTYQASPLESTVYFILDDATYGQLDQEPLAY